MKVCEAAGCPGTSRYYAKGMCSTCYARAHRKAKPELYRAAEQRKRQKHGDKIRAYDRVRSRTEERRKKTKEYYYKNIEDRKAYEKARAQNPERKLYMKKLRRNTIERVRASDRQRYRRDRIKRIALIMQRRAHKGLATPKWLSKEDKDLMRRFYAERPQGYHVDHIIPLQHRDVCGLHVPWNLQYMPATDNIQKGNRNTDEYCGCWEDLPWQSR